MRIQLEVRALKGVLRHEREVGLGSIYSLSFSFFSTFPFLTFSFVHACMEDGGGNYQKQPGRQAF